MELQVSILSTRDADAADAFVEVSNIIIPSHTGDAISVVVVAVALVVAAVIVEVVVVVVVVVVVTSSLWSRHQSAAKDAIF